jgi:hypothetical protein
MSFSGNSSITRAQIETLKEQGLVMMTDKDESLESYCYTNIPSNDPNYLKRCRGIVFDGEELVMEALPYTEELPNEMEILRRYLPSDLSTCKIFPSCEGTLLRVFNYKEKWYTTTHRKLDANRSKWGSRQSFGSYFAQALKEACRYDEALRELLGDDEKHIVLNLHKNVLNPSRIYLFLLLANEHTRVVCDAVENPTVFHVGTIIDGKLDHADNIQIRKPDVLNVSNLDDLIDWVNTAPPTLYQGAIIFGLDNRQYKVLNENYKSSLLVRGNVPSVKFRYLQIRNDVDLVDRLLYLYPDKRRDFDKYEECLELSAKRIYTAYVNRFIHKQHTVVPQDEFNVMKKCHEWHCTDRNANHISLEKVRQVLSDQTPTFLNHMIRKMLYPSNMVNEGLKRIRIE